MASAQIAGTYSIFIRRPDGAEKLVKSANAYWFGPGGASEATPANTPEIYSGKWNYLPLSADTGGPGYSIVLKVNPGSAATVGGDDGFLSLPVMVNGSSQVIGADAAAGLGNSNFTADISWNAQALIASQDNIIAVYRAKEGVYFKIGGDRIFCMGLRPQQNRRFWSVENNA